MMIMLYRRAGPMVGLSILLLLTTRLWGDEISKGWMAHVEAINNAQENGNALPGRIKVLADQIQNHVRSQDPVPERRQRLDRVKAFLEQKQTTAALGKSVDELSAAIAKEEETHLVRIMNQVGDTLRIGMDGIERPLMVPLNKVKRYMLKVPPGEPEKKTLRIQGAVHAGDAELEIGLIGGGGTELTMTSLEPLKFNQSPKANLRPIPIKPALSRQEIDEAIKQLGADRFSDRKNASDRLIEAAPTIRSQLSEAHRKATDPEVRARLQEILKKTAL